MTRPGWPTKKKSMSAGGTVEADVTERIDVGPVAPVPVVYGRPEAIAFDERVNLGPAPTLQERVNISPGPVLQERVNISPGPVLQERVNLGPAPTLQERVEVGPAVPATVSSREAMSETLGPAANGPGTPGPGGRWAATRPRSAGTSGVTIGAGIRAAAGGKAASPALTGPSTGPATAPARPAAPLPVPKRPTAPAPDRSAAAKIRIMFKDYQGLKNPQEKQASRTTMLALCEAILPKTDDPRRGAYIDADTALVGDIHAVLERDQGQAKAQARYVTDAYAGDPSFGVTSPTKLTTWKQQDVKSVLMGAEALHSGTSVSQLGPADLAVVEKYGLTHAEIVAVRAYTAANYEFINPATENNRRGGGHDDRLPEEEKSLDWMKAQNKKQDANGQVVDLDPAELEAHFAEGSLHAGVLMMALKKLEDKKGQLYRGERLTPKEFQENYISKNVYKIHTFKSNSLKEEAAAVFARGNSSTGPAKTVSVMCVLDVIAAKDIKDLSLYAKEAEWLIPPGSVFSVGKPIREPLGKYGDPAPGVPPATECYTVHLKQIK